MSGAQTPPAGAAGSDPSMEDILASIRRILSEEETPATAEPPPEAPAADPEPSLPPDIDDEPDDVLVLDNSMLLPDPEPEPEPEPMPLAPSPPVTVMAQPIPMLELEPEPEPEPAAPFQFDEPALLAPAAAAAATSSVSNLVRSLAADRSSRVYHGGPTIEDLVREEMRPLLKLWLDQNLPPLVERLVRAEIERVVARAVP